MADGRMLKRKISIDVKMADLREDTHRLLFTWGIPHLDIEGRISGNPREFKAAVAPLLEHITTQKTLDFFEDAANLGLIQRYEVDGRWVVQYPGFKKNQTLRSDREAPSKYPAPTPLTPCQKDSDSSSLEVTPGVIPEDSRTTPAKDKLNKRRKDKYTPPGFEAFYNAYPRKKARKDAEKAWARVNPDESLFHTIMIALEKQKASEVWKKDNGKYIPHPASWLNGERWTDEVQQEKNSGGFKSVYAQ